MKKFNIVLVLFLVAQSTNTYSMNALRRAASRATTYVNRLAPRTKYLADSLIEKAKSSLENNIKRAKRFYNTSENTLFKKVESVQSLPKQNQHSTAKKNFSIKPIINSKEKTNIKNIGLAGALGTSGVYLLLDKNNVSCAPNFENFTFELLCNYLKKNPNSLEEIFPYLYSAQYEYFLRIFPQYRELLWQLVSNNFPKYNGLNIKHLAKTFPNHHDQLWQLVSNNFPKYNGFNIKYLAKTFPNHHDQLWQLVSNNFPKYNGVDIEYLDKTFPNYHDQLWQLVSNNFPKYNVFDIKDLAKTFPNHHDQLWQLVSNNFPKYDGVDIEYLDKAFPNYHDQLWQLIEEKLLNNLDKNSAEYLHIKHCLSTTFYANCIKFLSTYLKFNQFRYALTKKMELQSQGYVSFFHGQESQFGFLEDFSKELFNALTLQGLINASLREDFLFIQNPTELLTKDSQAILQDTKKEQNNMIKGRFYEKEKYRVHNRLSANSLVSGNNTNSGSCTWQYVINNSNVNNHNLDLQSNIMEPFNIPQELYSKYKDRFNLLLQKHKALFKKGRLLLIAIPKEKVDQYAYLAKTGAYKTTHQTIYGKIISTVPEFLNIIKQNPDQFSFDSLDRGSEVAIPLTQAYALNPYSDIKIFAFDAEPTDQAEYEQYLKERKQLAEDIAKDVAEINKQTHEFDGLEVCCKEITESAKTAQSFY